MKTSSPLYRLLCLFYRRQSVRYLEDTLSSERRSAMSRHLMECGKCRQEVRDLQKIIGSVRQAAVPAPAPSGDLWQRLEGKLQTVRVVQPSTPLRRTRRVYPLLGSSLVTAAAALVFVLHYGPGAVPAGGGPADGPRLALVSQPATAAEHSGGASMQNELTAPRPPQPKSHTSALAIATVRSHRPEQSVGLREWGLRTRPVSLPESSVAEPPVAFDAAPVPARRQVVASLKNSHRGALKSEPSEIVGTSRIAGVSEAAQNETAAHNDTAAHGGTASDLKLGRPVVASPADDSSDVDRLQATAPVQLNRSGTERTHSEILQQAVPPFSLEQGSLSKNAHESAVGRRAALSAAPILQRGLAEDPRKFGRPAVLAEAVQPPQAPALFGGGQNFHSRAASGMDRLDVTSVLRRKSDTLARFGPHPAGSRKKQDSFAYPIENKSGSSDSPSTAFFREENGALGSASSDTMIAMLPDSQQVVDDIILAGDALKPSRGEAAGANLPLAAKAPTREPAVAQSTLGLSRTSDGTLYLLQDQPLNEPSLNEPLQRSDGTEWPLAGEKTMLKSDLGQPKIPSGGVTRFDVQADAGLTAALPTALDSGAADTEPVFFYSQVQTVDANGSPQATSRVWGQWAASGSIVFASAGWAGSQEVIP